MPTGPANRAVWRPPHHASDRAERGSGATGTPLTQVYSLYSIIYTVLVFTEDAVSLLAGWLAS
jgi:hypothetical protein